MRWLNVGSEINEPSHTSAAIATLFFRFVFRLSGFVNVVLILTTRPNVLLFGSRGVLPVGDYRRRPESRYENKREEGI